MSKYIVWVLWLQNLPYCSMTCYIQIFLQHIMKEIFKCYNRGVNMTISDIGRVGSIFAYLSQNTFRSRKRESCQLKGDFMALIYSAAARFALSRCPNKWTGLSEADGANHKRNHQCTSTSLAPTGIGGLSISVSLFLSVFLDKHMHS